MCCQLEALRHCLPPSVRGILEGLPETLDATYERVLRAINKENREHACRLLRCLTVALRPLRVEELAEVLAIDFDAPAHGGIPHLNPNWRCTDQHQGQAVLSTCSSLITLVDDGDSQVVQFSHFSVREFLTSDRLACSSRDVSRYHIALEPAHTIMAQACLGVLLSLDNRVNENIDPGIPLVQYAAQHWVDHAWFDNVPSRIRDTIDYFLAKDKPHWTAWCRVQVPDVSWRLFTPSEPRHPAFPLYYASLGGFYHLAEHLVRKHPGHIHAKGGLMVTPLVAALHGKHFQIAELLRRHGANVDVKGNVGATPLRAACESEDLDIVQWLLDHGADVDAQDDQLWTPLHDAASYGRLEIFWMLIEHNANVHLRNDLGELPLHQAASPCDSRGHLEIMQSLLNHGANPNARDNNGSTPLHCLPGWEKEGYKKTEGTVEGARLLLKHGAIIDAEDNEGRTPLQVAFKNRREDIVEILSKHGATK